MSTTYLTLDDAVDSRYKLEVASGMAGVRITVYDSRATVGGEAIHFIKFWVSPEKVEDLSFALKIAAGA